MSSQKHNGGLRGQYQQNVSRRNVLRGGVGLGISVSGLSALLASCGGDDDEPDAEATTATADEGQSGSDTPATTADESSDETPESTGSGGGTEERPSGEAAGEEAILNFGGIQEPITLDGHLSTSESDETLYNVYARLIHTDRETGEITPELATEWEISSDGLEITMKLRDDVLFHDGTPFNAEAAVANFERCIALQSFFVEAFENIDTVEAVDEAKLLITLIEPLAPFVSMLVSNPKMISPTAIEEHRDGDDYAKTWLVDNAVGSGAYRVVRWDRSSNLELEAFPDYWLGWEGKHVTTVNYRFVAEPGTQRLMVESGELDVSQINIPDSIPEMQSNPDLNVVGGDQPNQLYIQLNNFTGPTSDARVRKAICHGFNFEEYVSLLSIDPPPRRADMPVPTQLYGPGYEPVEIPYNTYDPDAAKALLEEAGFGDGFSMNIFTDPTPQKVVLVEYFQASMAQIGIDVSIFQEPFTNLLARGTNQDEQRDWDTAMHAMVLYTAPAYPDPSYFLLRMFTPYPASVRNLLGYENQEVAQLTEEGLRSGDPDAAMELYWQANLLIVEDCPNLLLDRSVSFNVLRNAVKGYVPHVHKAWPWTFYDIWKEL